VTAPERFTTPEENEGVKAGLLSKVYVGIVTLLSLVTLVYVYAVPLQSARVSRDGVPHFTPPVAHPETGEPLDMGALIRHYKGE
jgi:hypothetical protein